LAFELQIIYICRSELETDCLLNVLPLAYTFCP
jgi:hypothetical protein